MEYRARLFDSAVVEERPQEIFGTNRAAVDQWATKKLDGAVSTGARVEIYQTTETLITVMRKPEPKPEPAK